MGFLKQVPKLFSEIQGSFFCNFNIHLIWVSDTEYLFILHSKIFESSKLINTAILMQHVIGLTGISSVIYETSDPSSLGITPTEQIDWKMSSNKASFWCVYFHVILWLNYSPFFLCNILSNGISHKRTICILSSILEQRKFPRKERIIHSK